MQRRRFSMGIMSRAVFILVLFCCSSLLVNGGFHKKARYKFSGPIKTVVVLVMENRSFDHMLGWLKRLNPEIDGVTGEECNPLNTLDDESPSVCFSDNAEFVDPDPGHSFPEIREQVFGSNDTSAVPPPMNGFAQQAESMAEGLSKTVMNGFRPELVPAYTALAMEFAVLDKWFSSTPTSTQPNRLFVQSATSHGLISNVRNALIKGFPQKTIFDSVHEAGLSFGIYYQNIPAVLFFKNLRRLKYITKFHDYKLAFKLHAKLGKLPNYAVIEQRYFDVSLTPANDDHPSHDISQGQNLVKEIYEALRSSPQWNETLFVITYDEHGGFYDHVPTPNSHVPNPDGIVADDFDFKRLGVRVPTIMVSPWINKGTVMHGPDGPTPFSQFEHSSIPATVKKLFGLEKFLTKRDAWAGTFENIIGARTTPRTDCPVELPNSPWSLRHSRMNEHAKISEFQQELVILAAHLNGDHALMNNLYLGKTMTVRQANDYVEDAVASFLNTGLNTLKAGANESNVLQLTRSAGNRKEGPANFLLSQD